MKAVIDEIARQAEALARALNVRGLMNVQMALKDGTDLPARSQSAGQPHSPLRRQGHRSACRQDGSTGHGWRKPAAQNFQERTHLQHIAIKEAVFPFARFTGVDLLLGPGNEVHRRSDGPRSRFWPRLRQITNRCGCYPSGCRPEGAKVFISVKDSDKAGAAALARDLAALGFEILATRGTVMFFAGAGISAVRRQQGA